jgi:hypothetical protein
MMTFDEVVAVVAIVIAVMVVVIGSFSDLADQKACGSIGAGIYAIGHARVCLLPDGSLKAVP